MPAEFEVNGITQFMEIGQTYDYTTLTNYNAEKETVGALEVVSYDIVEFTDKYPAKEGYEWRIVTMKADISSIFTTPRTSVCSAVTKSNENLRKTHETR